MSGVGIGVGTALGVVGALVVFWHGVTYYEVDVKCERPKYSVVKKLGKPKRSLFGLGKPKHPAEIRKYAPVLAAEVTLHDVEMRDALSEGFRSIAGFIFGKNTAVDAGDTSKSQKVAMTAPVTLEVAASAQKKSQKIAMTAPVTAETDGNNSYTVSFIMPSEYTKETLPKPLNSNIIIKEVPSRTMAALSWSGSSPSQIKMYEKAAELRMLLKESGIEIGEDVNTHTWQYHPPFAPAWMRLNEVLFEINEDDVDEKIEDVSTS